MESDFVRKNGLQWPPHKLQVATWVLFPLLVVQYFGFLRPLIWLPDSLGIFITILFTVMCVLAVVFGYITCAIDPADDSLLNEDGTHKTNNKNLSNMPTSGSTQGDTTIYCYLCESNVDKSAKHCRYCQKCVTRYVCCISRAFSPRLRFVETLPSAIPVTWDLTSFYSFLSQIRPSL